MFKKKEEKSCFKPGKCLHCVDFICTSKVEKVHNVLKHYPQEKSIAFEVKPRNIYTNGGAKIYEINSTEHGDYYDFKDSDDIIDKFLLTFRGKFAPLEQEVVVKYDFKLQNIHRSSAIFAIPIINSHN